MQEPGQETPERSSWEHMGSLGDGVQVVEAVVVLS